MTTESVSHNIREALNDAGFDWGNGKVYRPAPDASGKGLLQITNDDPYLSGRAAYYAVDGEFVYTAAFMNFFGTEGIFPSKARKDSVQTIEVNAAKYFEGDSLKDTLVATVNGLEILSMVDVQCPEGIEKRVDFHIVGSKDVPFFVCTISEENSIRLFLERILRSARLAVLNQTVGNSVLNLAFGKGLGN